MNLKKHLYRVDVEYSTPTCSVNVHTSFTVGAVPMTDQLAAAVATVLYAKEGAVVSAKLVDISKGDKPGTAESNPCGEINIGDMVHPGYAQRGTGMV